MSQPSESTPLLLSSSNDANVASVDHAFAKDAVAHTESSRDGEAQMQMRSDGGSDDDGGGHSLTVAKKSKEVSDGSR
jgi:hypothetical protein